MITHRAWRAADYDALSGFLAKQAANGLPDPPMLLPGDLAWRLPGSQPEKNLHLFFSNSELAAFAWFEPLTGFEFDVRDKATDRAELMRQILHWADGIRRSLPAGYPRFIDITDMAAWRQEISAPKQSSKEEGYYLTTVCPESDQDRIRWLKGQGFHSTDHFAPVYFRDLRERLPEPSPPPGCRLRSVTGADKTERIAVHRAAWEGSQFDEARYAEIRSTPAYREELDIVLEEADTFGSYCICWADPESRIGHFEPVGTRSDWRGRGAARAVILEGLRRLQAADMRWARVSTAGFNTPAQALYESCGFKQAGIERTYMKKL
jgi:ribosomal protein S18 acetylase RimI-like enzyme